MGCSEVDGKPQAAPELGYLLPHLRAGTIEKNARQHHPLRIAQRSFARGIDCLSTGTVDIHLPAPGKRFAALIGVDSNDISYYSSLGRGDLSVAVEVNGKQLFHSP